VKFVLHDVEIALLLRFECFFNSTCVVVFVVDDFQEIYDFSNLTCVVVIDTSFGEVITRGESYVEVVTA
jgi:hypothetical protein